MSGENEANIHGGLPPAYPYAFPERNEAPDFDRIMNRITFVALIVALVVLVALQIMY